MPILDNSSNITLSTELIKRYHCIYYVQYEMEYLL